MPVNVLTQRNAPDRRGVNSQETQLRPENVRFDRFGKLGSYSVDASVYAQPLFVSGVDCPGKGVKDLVIVATMGNSVYAFDAANLSRGSVWHAGPEEGTNRRLGKSIPSRFSYEDFYNKPIGILSTPVIELNSVVPRSGKIYLVTFELDEAAFDAATPQTRSSFFQHVLYALDLGTGIILGRQQIQGRYPGSGYNGSSIPPSESNPPEDSKIPSELKKVENNQITHTFSFGGQQVTVIDVSGFTNGKPGVNTMVHFNSIRQLQRPALLLQGNNLFIAFGSRGDADPYHGWLFTYDKASFQPTGIFCTTPNGGRGGIWQAGQGLVQDSKGNVYASTGNGDNVNLGTGQIAKANNYGESFLSFRFDDALRLNGWFTFRIDDFTSNFPNPDDDFGAGAPALLPDERVVAGGKDGWFFLIDPNQLGQTDSQAAIPQAFMASFDPEQGSRVGLHFGTRHIHGSPVVWDAGANAAFVYLWGENDVVRVYKWNRANGLFDGQDPDPDFKKFPPPQGRAFARANIYASNEVAGRDGMPGGFLALTWDGVNPNTGILWAAYPPFHNANHNSVPGTLAAFDAFNFDRNLHEFQRLTLLWHSRQNPEDDFGNFAKFGCPMIANGRVYQATGSNQIAIYGAKPNATPLSIDFDGGGEGFALNGGAIISPQGGIVLTEHAHNGTPTPYTDTTPTFLAGSVFTRATVNIVKFNTSFTFVLTEAAADGFTFTIQAEGPHALGSPGSGVGYTIDPFAPSTQAQQSTILHSFAVKFALGDPDGARTSHLAILVNGAQLPGFIDVDLRNQPTPIDLRVGFPITARLRYDGNLLFAQLQVQGSPASSPDFQLIVGNIAQQINAVQGTAFVGFTGGTGARSARQEIVAWTFKQGVFA
jgi:hypothetical protein